MEAPFPYQTLYFRRPLFSDDNKRLWSILIITSFFILLIHGFFVKWVSEFSTSQIRQNIKQDYIAYLAQSYSKKDVAPAMSLTTFFEPSTGDVATKLPAAPPESSSKEESKSGVEASSMSMDIKHQIEKTSQMGIATIGSAVEGVPGYTGRDYNRVRREKRLSYRNEDKLFRSHQDNILIPIPKTIQIASQNGSRDFYETVATMEANEIDIKYCFEKYARYDPSITGDLSISFAIHPDGFVIPASVKITKSTIRDPRISDCVRKQIQRWRNFVPLAYENGNFKITRKYVF